ncbi:MAG: GAF domain-containing protein [Armatimonadetes bacterium]|nr:GAF domain-containing protein [Armatimonadota bacterium]
MNSTIQTALLDAIHLATRKLASSRRLDDVLPEVLSICVEAVGAEGGTIYLHNKDKCTLEFRHVLPESSAAVLKFSDIPDDFGAAGRVFQNRTTEVSVLEPEIDPSITKKTGVDVHNMITVPLMLDDTEPIGIVQLINKREGVFNDDDQTVLETISSVSTLAYLNWQLLEEQTRASQLLGMGRVAHDIKNMAFALEANLTFSSETVKMAVEHGKEAGSDAESMGYLESIHEIVGELNDSIDRIKRYATLMSDLSAGKELAPEMKLAKLGAVVENAASFLESEGRKNGIEVNYDINYDAPATMHDSMFVFRIVQNLVSNAIKAVAETRHDDVDDVESVLVRYRFDKKHYIEVVDTGPGMTRETADKILRGSARSVWAKSSGSGWGTKIVLELTHAHGGEVSIDSESGVGTTFRVCLPHKQS